MSENRLGKFIRKQRGGMSLRDFAQKCNISHTHLDSIEKGIDPRTGKPVRITTETLKNIAYGMGHDFFKLAATWYFLAIWVGAYYNYRDIM